MSEHKAVWDISLDTTCPQCDHDFDLVNYHETYLWDSGVKPLENGTDKTRDCELTCPNCKHEFTVDFEY